MKRVLFLMSPLFFVPLAMLVGNAQPQTAAQQVVQTRIQTQAATRIDTSAASATTITMVPERNESVYIAAIDFSNCAGASAVTAAAPTTITTTNLLGAPAWQMGSGVTAGLCTQTFSVTYPNELKAQAANLPVTVILPTFATNQTIRVSVAWRSAP
jgi:hypothetical protein